ncbi:MAG: DUF1127 domain-containing protein [Rhodobacteraceae bacterium]|nr:DUF1127 domain-containing protein [Paracoccaceae bacterium]
MDSVFLELEDDMYPGNLNLMPGQVLAGSNGSARDGWFRQWLRQATRQWRRRRMIAALRAMDDRLLNDIGIHRQDIEPIVDGFDDRELRMLPVAAELMATAPDGRRQAA